MKASRKWIIWAHGPCVDTGNQELYPSSFALMDLAEGPGRGNVEVPPDLISELVSVAELYGRGSAMDEMGPWWKAERNRVIREGREVLRRPK